MIFLLFDALVNSETTQKDPEVGHHLKDRV